jgi:hypothetical protein
MGRELWVRTNMVRLVLISGSLVKIQTVCLGQRCWASVLCTWPCKEELVCGYAWQNRIVGVENIVEEEEYNQFDEIPSFDTSTSPDSWELTKHCTCEVTIVKIIHIQKSRKKKQAWFLLDPFCNAGGCVYWWKWNTFCNIKDAMYWGNFNPFCNIWDVVEFGSCL